MEATRGDKRNDAAVIWILGVLVLVLSVIVVVTLNRPAASVQAAPSDQAAMRALIDSGDGRDWIAASPTEREDYARASAIALLETLRPGLSDDPATRSAGLVDRMSVVLSDCIDRHARTASDELLADSSRECARDLVAASGLT
ncbi:MAG TPA: hypothetical protein VG943_13875 [Caulobacterales bacterium]|nr:hypothetical protein [Caulobacterales bacterium]